jgi:hypothetical protein
MAVMNPLLNIFKKKFNKTLRAFNGHDANRLVAGFFYPTM